jgi:hypothetical protein
VNCLNISLAGNCYLTAIFPFAKLIP